MWIYYPEREREREGGGGGGWGRKINIANEEGCCDDGSGSDGGGGGGGDGDGGGSYVMNESIQQYHDEK